ncbi:glycoside hydrolase family 15 protein [Terrabacter sp. 2YAF2]|uniref:glycoside hydrolase family 15 protein n=1 Tax=Terrabacter sp. 2YAF2 TaxID=3233026 RepID=UPI003F9B401E
MTISPPTTDALVSHAVEVLLSGQAASGAFVAAPTYPTYRFAWLRDGSFCADALDRHGRGPAASKFHAWVVRTLLGMARHVEHVTASAATTPADGMLPTRFELDGTVESGEENWPNFQLDGYGTWLWAFAEHVARRGATPDDAERQAIRLVADYLVATGDRACYDCWEESDDRRHAATVAASVAGLRAAAALLADDHYRRSADDLHSVLMRDFVSDGSFVKHDDTNAVDASLLWIAVPFGVVDVHDPVFARTAARVEAELLTPGGGVLRYLGDTYYGGGEWLLLTAWSGWVHLSAGRVDTAYERLRWVERQASETLDLPEQVIDHPQDPTRVGEWLERWGPVATPLLWSHAMYLTLVHEIGSA